MLQLIVDACVKTETVKPSSFKQVAVNATVIGKGRRVSYQCRAVEAVS
ncbi:hypothetical protein [Grimontia hollisae]|nr:hypothetical protein [Grimontia hollisae]